MKQKLMQIENRYEIKKLEFESILTGNLQRYASVVLVRMSLNFVLGNSCLGFFFADQGTDCA